MKRFVTSLAAAGVMAATLILAPSASAANSYSVAVGVPGLALGYSNYGGYVGPYAPPTVYYAPPPSYYYGAPYYYRPPVVAYGPYRHWHQNNYYYHRHW